MYKIDVPYKNTIEFTIKVWRNGEMSNNLENLLIINNNFIYIHL